MNIYNIKTLVIVRVEDLGLSVSFVKLINKKITRGVNKSGNIFCSNCVMLGTCEVYQSHMTITSNTAQT